MQELEQRLTAEKVSELDWYYTVELLPGAFTKGRKFINVVPTKRILSRADLTGMNILDIGTMEGLFSVLAARGGARVTSYDRLNFSDRVALVQRYHECRFEHICGMNFYDFVSTRHSSSAELFDGIIFSGVLYHTISPTLFLYLVRTLMKIGGTLFFETAAVVDNDAALFFNKNGRFYPQTNYYQPSTAWIDYFLRLIGYRIIDVEYVDQGLFDSKRIVRVAMTCVLGDDSVLETSDVWGNKRLVFRELAEFQPIRQSPRADWSERVRPDRYSPGDYYNTIEQRTLKLTDVVNGKAALAQDHDQCVLHLRDRLR